MKKMISFMLICTFVIYLFNEFFAARLVDAMYHGNAPEFMSNIIRGQDAQPLSYYQNLVKTATRELLICLCKPIASCAAKKVLPVPEKP